MSDTKIFSLGDQSAGGSMPAILASLCQNRGLDPNMVAAMMNNRGNGWGDSAWWIIILLIFGWGGFGESVCYLAGNIAAQMYPIAKNFLCTHCRKTTKKFLQQKNND